MGIYLEIRTNHMRRTYEGELISLEHFPDHILFNIRQWSGKGAIVDVPHENIVLLRMNKDMYTLAKAA